MSYKKVELSLYTAMNEYNKYGDNFNKVIINDIDTTVTKQIKDFEYYINKINLDEIGPLILKYSEVSLNCKQLLDDLNNANKINILKKSIEELKIIEEDLQTKIIDIMKKLGLLKI